MVLQKPIPLADRLMNCVYLIFYLNFYIIVYTFLFNFILPFQNGGIQMILPQLY